MKELTREAIKTYFETPWELIRVIREDESFRPEMLERYLLDRGWRFGDRDDPKQLRVMRDDLGGEVQFYPGREFHRFEYPIAWSIQVIASYDEEDPLDVYRQVCRQSVVT